MNRLVYDSEFGRTMCPRCRKRVDKCKCAAETAAPAGDGVVRVRREVRRGKPVTVVFGLALPPDEVKALAKALKKQAGGGGAVKDGAIELQGDHRDMVVAALEGRGMTVKRAGG